MDAATLHHTISFLLNPLFSHFPSQTIDALHNSLLSSFSSLTTHSAREHVFLISPTAPAPPIIAHALSLLPPHLTVTWADWSLLLSNGNQVVLSVSFNPGAVTAAVRNAKTGLVDFNTIYDAKQEIARRAANRSSRIWGPPSTRSSAESSSTGSTSDFSSSSRASSPDVVAVETAENVLSGIYDDDDDDEQVVFGKFGAMSLLPRTMTASPQSAIIAPPRKSSLSAAAAEWFPRSTPPTKPFSPFSPTIAPPAPQPQRVLPTPIGAHRQGHHSRSSSRSSTLSLGTTPSLTSTSTCNNTDPPSPTLSDTAGSVDLYIDPSKDQQAVTEYECGKVGVLTGAVMLGVPKNSSNGSAVRVWKRREQPAMAVGPQALAAVPMVRRM